MASQTMMTLNASPECTRCWYPVEYESPVTSGNAGAREGPGFCTPIIDAEQSNEALRLVARIRARSRC